jgi:hypothetical protein
LGREPERAVIGVRDHIRLPAGVELTPEGLRDDVRGETFAVNETARALLVGADGRGTAELAELLVARFGIASEAALVDARSFCRALNERFLLNVDALTATRRRRHVDTSTVLAALISTARALAGRAAAVGSLAAAVTFVLLAGLGAPMLGPPLALGAALALSLVLHEGGHAAALRGVPCCVCLAGVAVLLLHRPLPGRRRALVAVSGPLTAGAAGLAALAVAAAFQLEELGPAALVLLSHVAALTVAGRDGRVACGLS